jgi:CubicO group peptidase (beta-lactamase class C family)
MLLGKIVEKAAGMSLEECLQEKVLTSLAMKRTVFNPLEKGFSLEEIAPTEEDLIFRKRLIQGTVHDEKADLLGGIAGHAGLFGTAGDLFLFMQSVLEKPNPCEWGWEAMPLFGEKAFGHFGFTGTALWADPETKRVVILLTNRVHPTRANIKIREVRRKLVESLIFHRK